MGIIEKLLQLVEYDLGKGPGHVNELLINEIIRYLEQDILDNLQKDIEDGFLESCNYFGDDYERRKNVVLLKTMLVGWSKTRGHGWVIKKNKEILEDESIYLFFDDTEFYKRHRIKKMNLKEFHRNVCNKLFADIEDSYKKKTYFWIGVDGLNADESYESWEVNQLSKEGKYTIKLSVLSGEILDYDQYIFEALENDNVSEIVKELYKPFIVEYYINQEMISEEQRKFLREMYLEQGWYKATLADMEYEIDGLFFEGVFVQSASPIHLKRKKLIIEDTTVDSGALNKINKVYDMSGIKNNRDDEVASEIAHVFGDTLFYKSRIYSAGNGNCIYNYGYDSKKNKFNRFFYDIGFDMHVHIGEDISRTENKYQAALKNIRSAVPHCIILSHWDEDHFRACTYANKRFFDVKWITPSIKTSEKKANAKRLLIYLSKIDRLLVVARGVAREIDVQCNSGITKWKLYVGARRKGVDNAITNCNCEGIAICLDNRSKGGANCMMMGDVPYSAIPKQANFSMKNPYDYLVAPHHGARMAYPYSIVGNSNKGKAVICCDGVFDNNRPEKKHLSMLQNSYDVELTADAKNYIEFNLKKSGKMNIH